MEKSDPICPECKETQWSIMDKKYLEQNSHCWGCDKKLWEAGKLTLKEFEQREMNALITEGKNV